MGKLRAAVVGCGAAGIANHIPWYRRNDNVELVGLVDPNTAQAEWASARWGGRAYGSLAGMLEAERPDLVSIASPVHLHHPQTLQALESNCHVLCEKPVGRTPGECREMTRAAHEKGLIFGAVLDKHFCQALLPGGSRLTFEQAAEMAGATGYDSIEVHLDELVQVVEEKSLDYVSAQFGKHGVKPGAWQVQFRRQDTWRMDDEIHRDALEALPHYAEVAARLGCTRAFQWLPCASNDRPYDTNFAWHVERLKPMAKILGEHGCVFGLEWQGVRSLRRDARYEFVHTQHQLQALIDAIDEENVGFLLDTWHWYTAHGTLADIRSLKAEDVVLVHFNDAPEGVSFDDHVDLVREVPGRTGIIDLIGFLKALKDIGYRGPVEPGVPGCPYLDAMSTEEAARTNLEATASLMRAAGIPSP